MHCPYCRSANESGDQRCARCGRRLNPTSGATGAARFPVQRTSAAPDLVPVSEPQSGRTVPKPVNFQPWLFRDSSAGPRVVPIPTLTSAHPANREPGTRRAASRTSSVPRAHHRVSESQQSLAFAEEAPVYTPVEETILCDAPVALPLHRLTAAAVDAAIILCGAILMLGTFFAFADGVVFSRTNSFLLLGAVGAVAVLYRSLWCLGDGDTPGMRASGLQLVDFDGRRPNRDKRLIRQFASVLSLLSAGLGLVWSLVDEERLTWHDHISKTFPTPVLDSVINPIATKNAKW